MSPSSYLKRKLKGEDDRDFLDSVVPLAKSRQNSNDEKANDAAKSIDGHSSSSSDVKTEQSATTLESLREEVDRDIAVEGHNTAYDRMFESCK